MRTRDIAGNWPDMQREIFTPAGGLDIVTPPFQVPNGTAIAASNMELNLEAGYARISGYDRFVHGRTISEMVIRRITITINSGVTLQTGNELFGQLSFAYVKFLGTDTGQPEVSAGTHDIYVEIIEEKEIVLGEPVFFTGIGIIGTFDSLLMGIGSGTFEEQAEARKLVEELMRPMLSRLNDSNSSSLVQTTGAVLGIEILDDLPLAFVKNAASDTVVIRQPIILSTLRQNRLWGLTTTTTIPSTGAKFEFAVSRLGMGVSTQERLFGVSGTSKAFYYDRGKLTFITTGMVSDIPKHIAVHVNRVFLSFGASLQFSQAGDPDSWTPVLGAGEINAGDEITGLLSLTGESQQSALLVSTRERLLILYGDAESNFQLVPFATNSGAYSGTLQWMGQAIFQNLFGLSSMNTSQSFGGFNNSAISNKIKPFLDSRLGKATCSMIVRGKNQYRIFFNDGSGVYVTFKPGRNGGLFPAAFFPVQFAHKVTACCSYVTRGVGFVSELPAGEEVLLIGTEDGEIMRLDVGRTFNGQSIPWNLRLAFNHFKDPRRIKQFKRALLEVRSAGYTVATVGYDLDYRGPERAITNNQIVETEVAANQFGTDLNQTQYKWDVLVTEPITVDTPGSGVNLSLRFEGNDKVSQPFTLTGVIVNYVLRRLKR